MATVIGSGLESYLHRQAREKALNRIAEAQEEARQILGQVGQEVESLRRASEAQTARTIADERRRALAHAHLSAKQAVIHRQDELLERLWQDAEQRLRTPGEPAARLESLITLVADAAQQLGGGTLELQVNEADRQLLNERMLRDLAAQLGTDDGVKELTLAPNALPIWGGVVVRRTDTNEMVDNSYNERLALVRRTLRDEVYRRIAPSSSAGRPSAD